MSISDQKGLDTSSFVQHNGRMAQEGETLGRVWDHIDAARVELDLTWDELAERSGVARATFYNIQSGRTPAKLTRKKIEDAVGWSRGSIAKIMRGEEPTAKRVGVDPRTASADQLGELLEETRQQLVDDLGEDEGLDRFAELLHQTLTVRSEVSPQHGPVDQQR